MHLRGVLLAPGNGAVFYDGQAAIRAGATQDGFIYVGELTTLGFASIRVPATSLSVGLVLDNGSLLGTK
ncbi:hypothetical protein NKJ95_32615 [Mesorhizobium sp. M0012]|uniref:hypothetical protein n=1 Tax=Mesorhizobium sp. M0012 TaxID=2956840 RepID=UPI003335C22F